jgi:multidrug efflux pump subunit AcrA (membrane-fusion protein)
MLITKKEIVSRLRKYRIELLFGFSLLALIGLIWFGNRLREETPLPETPPQPVKVAVYNLTEEPAISVSGQVEISPIKIVRAQTAGFVQTLNVVEGQNITRGQRIVSLSTTPTGGNPASIQSQIARSQYEAQRDSFDDQLEAINIQKQMTETTRENVERNRELIDQSVRETRELVNLNRQILSDLSQQLEDLEELAPESAEVLQLRQAVAGQRASLLQLESNLRANELQAGRDDPPTQLADFQQDLANRQLAAQERGLKTGLEVARLQWQLAQLNEAVFIPASPVAGIVERVLVAVGDSVTVGQELAIVNQYSTDVKITVQIPAQLAGLVNRNRMSTIIHAGQIIPAELRYISTAATNGVLYTLSVSPTTTFSLPENTFVKVSIPLQTERLSESIYIPLDALHLSQTEAMVYIVEESRAKAMPVEVGMIAGSFVEIVSGLDWGMEVILNRNITHDQPVTQ